ncbi:putative cytochrome P450 CYP44, partial [Orchesella cincta]
LNTEVLTQHIKKFEDIPGPVRLPLLGNALYYKFGIFNISEYHNVLRNLYDKYGPVVRQDIGNRTVIHAFDPDDVKNVLNSDGKTPIVPPLQETTKLYREKRELSPGLGNTNGDEWYRLRKAVQKMMLRPNEVHYYLPFVDTVAKSFVEKIEACLDTNRTSSDLRDLVAKWSLESAGMVCFERRLGALDKNEQWAEEMVTANKIIFTLGGHLKHSLPVFKYIMTPKWRKFLEAEDFFYSNASKVVDESVQHISQLEKSGKLKEGQYSFITYLLSREELSLKDVFIITQSLFGDGLSTTTPSFMFNLYCLAKHPDIQTRIFQEINGVVPLNGAMTVEMINRLRLLKAAVKETFRLYPNGTEISRITQTDLIIGNYRVPSGTHVDLNQFVLFRSPKYFQSPDEYIPDRWLREDQGDDNLATHPFLMIPFGHGTRMCAGRRFAEQDMYTALTRILQKYHLELTDPNEEMDQVYQTLLFPKHPLKIRFLKR